MNYLKLFHKLRKLHKVEKRDNIMFYQNVLRSRGLLWHIQEKAEVIDFYGELKKLINLTLFLSNNCFEFLIEECFFWKIRLTGIFTESS